MKLLHRFFLTLMLSVPLGVYAQKPTIENIENSNLYEQAIVSTDDGGFIYVSRSTSSFTNASTRIVRRDSDLNILWDTIYGGTGMERIFGIAKVQGGYVFSGTSTSTDGTLQGIPAGTSWFFKINEQGEMVWQKRYDGAPYFRRIQQTKNGDLIVCGTATSESAYTRGWNEGSTTEWGATSPNGDGWIAKLNQDGDTLWTSRCIGGSGQEYLIDIIEDTVNGGFVATGMVKSEDGDLQSVSGTGAYWIVKVTDNGELEWQKRYGGSGSFEDPSAIRSTETGYIISGRSTSVDGDISSPKGGGSTDIWVIWIDRNGTFLQERSYGGTQQDGCQSMISTSDGGFLLLGQTGSSDGDVDDNPVTDFINCAWVVKINPQGVVEWTKFMYINGKGAALPNRGIQRNDGSFIIISSNWLAKLSPCPEHVSESATVCENETYDFNGTILTAAGEYKDTLQTVGGCDSIITLALHHYPAYTVVQDASICAGEAFEFYDQSLTASGSYYHVLKSIEGCDSTISLRFVVNALPQPVLSVDNNVLTAGSYAEYEWYYNNAPLEANDHSLEAAQTGFYHVSVTDGNGCSDSSNALFVGVPVLDVFDFEGRYVWKFSIPGMGEQVSVQEYRADRIDYRMTGNVYANDYSMTMESYDGEEGRWIGVGSGGSSIVKDGIYYVLFFREYRGDSVLVYKHECVSREEAYTFVYPAEDAVSDYGWNWYVRDAGTGLYNFQGTTLVNLYPNPVQSMLQVVHPFKGSVSIHLYDAYGRLVQESEGAGDIHLDMSVCSSGIYLLQIYENNTLQYTERIIKR